MAQSTTTTFDGIISLGAWCQVGVACRVRGLYVINSPFHNFGIKWWQNVMEILQNRFEDYWQLENLSIGKAVDNYSAKHRENRLIYKVYCNKYYMVANHHFDADANTSTELLTYESFKEKIDVLTEVFYAQCELYETVLFVFKALSFPKETTIEKDDLLRFCAILDKLRNGKSYELRFMVPTHFFERVSGWVKEENLSHKVKVYAFEVNFNDEYFHEEWNRMLDDVKIADDYIDKLNDEIFQITDPRSGHIAYLNS